MPKPRESFWVRLSDGSNLSVAVFPTKNDPRAEVIAVGVSQLVANNWVTTARLALYRSPEGKYKQLPDQEKPVVKPTQI